jgi:hypothetical protein
LYHLQRKQHHLDVRLQQDQLHQQLHTAGNTAVRNL